MKRAVITTPYPTPEVIARIYGIPLAKVREFWELGLQTRERKSSTHPNGRAQKKSSRRKKNVRR
jgi:hypothetical protein